MQDYVIVIKVYPEMCFEKNWGDKLGEEILYKIDEKHNHINFIKYINV